MTHELRPHRDHADLAGRVVVAVEDPMGVGGVDDIGVVGLDGDVATLGEAVRIPVARDDRALVGPAGNADSAVVLLSAVDSVGKPVVGVEVVELRRRLVVDRRPRSASVEGHAGASVVASDHTPRIARVYPEVVIVSVGRRPHTGGLVLEKAGLSVNEKGFLPVNERCQTKVPHIYAIGDVSAPPLLAHKASYEGEVAAEAIAGRAAKIDYKAMPWAIFTTPEVAGVGYNEAEARARGYEVLVGKFPLAASGRMLTMGESMDGFIKIVADKKSLEVLGVGMVGPEVSNLISEGTLALEMSAALEDIALTVHVHPTLCEPLMEAAKHALGQAIHTLNR